MANSAGKKFEHAFKDSAKAQGIFVHRVKDSDLSFNGNSVSKFTTKNPCDFYLFGNVSNGKGNLFGLELKSTKYKSISIQTCPEETTAMIKMDQINSLIQMAQYEGIIAGFILNFRNEDCGTEDTYFIHIKDFSEFMANTDKKSINRIDIMQHNGIYIKSIKKRVNFAYNIREMITDVCEQY
jgi:penicillin-binding protein-related factor A (putative recombinase)